MWSWGYVGHLGAMLAHLGGYVAPSWGYVGPSWGYVGPSWGLCWPMLTHLEPQEPKKWGKMGTAKSTVKTQVFFRCFRWSAAGAGGTSLLDGLRQGHGHVGPAGPLPRDSRPGAPCWGWYRSSWEARSWGLCWPIMSHKIRKMGTAKNTVKRRIFWWSAAYLGAMLAHLGAMLA